jgi:hypothetical protein
MKQLTMTLALALAPAWAAAQTPAAHAAHHAMQPAAERMKTPCPLHLTTLQLTPAQDSAFKAIRAAHMAEMKSVHAAMGMPEMKHEPGMKHPAAGAAHADSSMHAAHLKAMKDMQAKPEAMKAAQDAMAASMGRALAAARAVLTPVQRETFDAAVKAHDAEKAERKAKGLPPCAGCCEHGEHAKQQ